MENQTRFNLSAAIESWRRELIVQQGLTPEDCCELETHLLDSITQLRKVGLTEGEAFWLACRRIGMPQEISEEFGNENPAKVWRDRLIWIAVALLGLQLWEAACFSLTSPFLILSSCMKNDPIWLSALANTRPLICYELIYAVTAIWFASLIHRGRTGWFLSIWEFLAQSRLRFLSVSVPLVVVLFALEDVDILLSTTISHSQFGYWFLLKAISPLAIVGFIAWLIPGGRREEAQVSPHVTP